MQEYSKGDSINHRYRIVRYLGHGAMGTVYLVEDVLQVHRLVALKVLNSDNLDDPDYWSRGEYEALTRLRHPNLARVFDFGRIQDSNSYYIVSEFIRGKDLLTDVVNSDQDELLDIFAQICRALEYIHTQGYVHFDVKPDNILVTRECSVGQELGSKVQWNPELVSGSSRGIEGPPRVKLIDFGLAERITGSFDFAIKGTFNYVAPEILRGKTPDKRADLYSFGVTLYHTLVGSYPFVGDDGHSLSRPGNWKDEVKRATDSQPLYLQEIIIRLLEEDPQNRFASAREIIQALNAGGGRCYEIETAETQASYLYCSRLVGRQKELNRLKEEAERIFSNPLVCDSNATKKETTMVSKLLKEGEQLRPPLFLLSGEIGIGKSRLFEEFTHFLRMREIPVYVGNCYETGHDAYQPMREIISQVAIGIGTDSELYEKYGAQIRKLCPRLRVTEDVDSEISFRPDKEQLYFIDRLSMFLMEAAASKPCVITINNLHWADESSLALLEHFTNQLDVCSLDLPCDLPLMLVATIRNDENYPPSLRSRLARLREEDCLREMHLRRLTRTQIAELIHHMLQLEEIPTPFLNRLEERTSGNPMFLVETLKGLQEEGIIARDGNAWCVRGDLNRVEISHGIEAILLRRVRMLDPQQQRIMQALSVYDKPVSGKLLERFPEFSGVNVMAGLRELENRGMIVKQLDGPRLQFAISQPKLREIVYANIPEDRRKVFHGSLADVLSQEHKGNIDEILSDLAAHYQRSDRVGKALELTLRAGDLAKQIYAYESAVEHYRHVLEQVEGSQEHIEVWLDTHEKLAEVGSIIGEYELSLRSYNAVLSEDLDFELDLVVRARLMRKRGKLDEIQGEYDQALHAYKAARDLIENGPSSTACDEEKVRVCNAIGWIYVCLGKFDKAMTISIEALRLLEGIEECNEHAMLFSTIGCANFYKGNIEQAIEFHRRSLEIRENQENLPDIIVSLNQLGDAHLASGEYLECLQHYKQALSSAEEIGDANGRAIVLHNLGQTYFQLGDNESTSRFLRESLKLSKQYKMRFLTNQNYFMQGRLHLRLMEYSKAESLIFRALGAFAKQGNYWGVGRSLIEIAQVNLARGDYEEALRLSREALENAHTLNVVSMEARCRMVESRILYKIRQAEPEDLLDRLEHCLNSLKSGKKIELLADLEVERGELLVALDRIDEAREAYAWAENHYREIADRLPSEFRESYLALHNVNQVPDEATKNYREIPEMPESETPEQSTQSKSEPQIRMPAVEGASLSDEQSELLRVASLLQEMGTTGPSIVFIEKVLGCVIQACGANQGFLLTRSADDVRVVAALDSRNDAVRQAGNFLCLEALEDCFEHDSSLLAPKIMDDPSVQTYEALYRNNISSLAILPLKSDGMTRGALYLNNPDPTHLVAPIGSPTLLSYQNLLALILPRNAVPS